MVDGFKYNAQARERTCIVYSCSCGHAPITPNMSLPSILPFFPFPNFHLYIFGSTGVCVPVTFPLCAAS